MSYVNIIGYESYPLSHKYAWLHSSHIIVSVTCKSVFMLAMATGLLFINMLMSEAVVPHIVVVFPICACLCPRLNH